MDTVHECDRQTDGRTELRSQRPCNAERRTVKKTYNMCIIVEDTATENSAAKWPDVMETMTKHCRGQIFGGHTVLYSYGKTTKRSSVINTVLEVSFKFG